MARVTVEDCVLRVPNRFDLVLAASQRARDILSGSPLTVDRDNDKNPVVALREIADGTVDPEILSAALIQALQKHVEVDEPEEDDAVEQLVAERGLAMEAPALVGDEDVGDDGLTIQGDDGEALDDSEV